MKPRAYAYIRTDIAEKRLRRYEIEARMIARAEGLDLARTIVDAPHGRGLRQLLGLIGAHSDATVLLPSLDHIPDTSLDLLGAHADVLTAIPRRRWARCGR